MVDVGEGREQGFVMCMRGEEVFNEVCMLNSVDHIVWFEVFVVEGVWRRAGPQLRNVDGGWFEFAAV